MCPHGYEIGETEKRAPILLQPPALHRAIVAGADFQAQAGNHLVLVFLQLQLAAFLKRLPILRQVAGAIPLAWSFRMLELGARNEVTGIGKSGKGRARTVLSGVSSGMIEMQVSIDDDRDLFRAHTGN